MNTLDNRYAVILADPPWRYRVWKGDHGKRTAESFYPTMSLEELCAMRDRIDQWAARDCALFLWSTPPALREGLDLLSAWGFTYKTFGFSWIKTNKGGGLFFGLGHYTRSNAEVCLLGIRGAPKVKEHDVPQVIQSTRREHSRKPDEQYARIMRLFDGPYLELFAREQWLGWDAWGKEEKRSHKARP